MSGMEQNMHNVPAVDEHTDADGSSSHGDDKTAVSDIDNARQQDTDMTNYQDPQSNNLSESPSEGLLEIGNEESRDQCGVSGLDKIVCEVDDIGGAELSLSSATEEKYFDHEESNMEVQHESIQEESSEIPHEPDISNMQVEVSDISGNMQRNMQSEDESVSKDFSSSMLYELNKEKKPEEDANVLMVKIGDGNKYKEVITNETSESLVDNSIGSVIEPDEAVATMEKHEAEVEDCNMRLDTSDEKPEKDESVVEILDASNQSRVIGTSQATEEAQSVKEIEKGNLNEVTEDEINKRQETAISSPSEAVDVLDGKAVPKTGSAERRMKGSSRGFSLGNIVSRLKIQVESKQEEADVHVSEIKKETGDTVAEKTQSKRSEQKQQGKQMRAAAHAAMLLYEDVESEEDSCNKVDDTDGLQEDGGKDMESYANNTMDELLGLYGYDTQDRNEKADVQICGSLSKSKIPITGSVQTVKTNQKQNQLHKPSQGDTGLVITNVTSMASSQHVTEKNLQDTEKKNSNFCAECSMFVEGGVMLVASDQCFCSQSCLDKYQSRKTLVCDYCSGMITQAANQKFVRETREGQKKFCSQPCSEEFSKRVRNCNTCGKEITKTSEGILAPVGSGGKFVDFCKQECVDNYGKKPLPVKQGQAKQEGIQPRYWAQDTFFVCAVCSNYAKAKHVISLHGKLNGLCSSDCFAQFKDKNQLAFSLCSQCNALCSNQKVMRSIEIEGKMHRFCSMRCFKMKLKRSMSTIACAACKKPNWAQSMIEEWNGTELVRFFCSTGCLSKRDTIPFTSSSQQNSSSTKTVVTTSSTKPVPPTQKQAKPQQTPQVPQTNISRTAAAASGGGGNKCDHCSKHQRPQYHLTMSDNSIRNFCTYGCVIAFQAQFNVPPVTLPQETLLLTCSHCQAGFSNKPLPLDFKGVVNVFCSQNCLDEFKRVNSVVMECDYCHLEKILHERIYFSGQARSFCSEGCKLLFKQQFAQRLGLRCTVCDYCAQTCRSRVERMYGNNKKKFCSMACKSQYDKWLSKGAKCDGCKCTGRKLEESFIWRGDMKRVCNQHCLLLFYTQQNIPNMNTQTQSTIPAIQFFQAPPKTTTPVITNVMSLAPGQQQQAGAPANNVKQQQKGVSHISSNIVKKCHKQTQITTAAPKQVKPPPPPVPLPPAPKMVKNKMTLVKPFSQTKSVSCRPLTSTKGTMTDEQPPAVIPIPVPVYVPVPMHMYTTPVPHPMTLPVPVPVPIFIPVAYNNADRLLACIKEIKDKIPSDPLEAEMLMLADAIAGDDGGQLSTTDEIIDTTSLPTLDGVEDVGSFTLDDTEEVIPSQLLADNILKMAADIAHVLGEEPQNELQDDLTSLQNVEEPKADLPSRNTRSKSVRRGRSRGNKRTCVEETLSSDSEQTSGQLKRSKEEARNTIGINAYRFFVSEKKKNLTGKELRNLSLSPNILDVSTEELGYILCSMCKEGTQPDGAKYSPDILHLIFLSIQHYLSENGRPENIFTDQFYRRFTDELHEEIKDWTIEYHPISDVILNTRINEETLWNAKQLGAHSPYILLSTMIYFNAKHFQLKTLDQHKALAFCRIQKHIRKMGMSRTMFLRYYPADRKKVALEGTSKRKRDRDSEESVRLEQSENTDNPLRCPVRLYEFYLSKCPDSVRSHSELFYLVPERSCVPDSPVWYSSSPLGDHEMNKILTRMLMVTDVNNAWTEIADDNDE